MTDLTTTGPPSRGPFLSVPQFEERHPGFRGRTRRLIFEADNGEPECIGLRPAIIRLRRSVLIDEALFLQWLVSHAAMPKSPARDPHGRAGKASPDESKADSKPR
jgi:hypothetical protein